MKKSDLRDGMVLLQRKGSSKVFREGHPKLQGIFPDTGYYELRHLDDNLLNRDGETDYDIVEVSYTWEREEVEEMTLAQICGALGKKIKIVKEN